MIKCKHCGMKFINKACVTKHSPKYKYIPPKTRAELEAEVKRLNQLVFAYESTEHPVNPLLAENEKLKEFACEIIKDYCWNHGDPDGCEIQDLAENLGLIKSRIATEKDVDPEWDDYEVGDTIFVFSDILKGNNNGN